MPKAKKTEDKKTFTVGLWMTLGCNLGSDPLKLAVWNVVEGKHKLDCEYQVTVQAVDYLEALEIARQMQVSGEIKTEAA